MWIGIIIAAAVLLLGGIVGVRAGWKNLGWTGVAVGGLLLVGLFTIRMAAPNVVTAGQKATERMAVSQLRTLLWAQEQFVTHAGRAGTIAEMSGAQPSPLSAPVLRPTFQRMVEVPGGRAALVSGYAFRVYVRGPNGTLYTDGGPLPPTGATDWIAYAWPEKRGLSAGVAFCINASEDILQTDNAIQQYDGAGKTPMAHACPRAGARLVPGKGGDGADWDYWRGKRTRRAKAADVNSAPSAPRSTSSP